MGTEAPASASSPAPGAGGTAGAAASGSASQRSPIPHEVLDAEYDMVHQVRVVCGGGLLARAQRNRSQ